MTIEELRKFKNFESIKEKEGHQVIEFLHSFCVMVYQVYDKEEKKRK